MKDSDTVLRNKDKSDVKDMLGSSLRAIKSNPSLMELLEEWCFLVSEMCSRKGACGDNECKCLETGRQATELMKIPCNYRWPVPPITLDLGNPGHYKTFRHQTTSLVFSTPDEPLKEVMIESCKKCKYVFTSEADRDKHVLLVYGGVCAMEIGSGSGTNATKKVHKCRVCDHEFPTRYLPLKHQSDEEHKSKRGRPSTRKD